MQRLLQERPKNGKVFLNVLLSHTWWRALMIDRDETSLASLRDSLKIHGSLPNWLLFHSANSLIFLQDKSAALYPLRILRDFPTPVPLCSFPSPSLSKSPEQSLYRPTCRATQTRRSASSTTMRSRWERNRAAVTAHHSLQHHDTHPPHHLLPPTLYIPSSHIAAPRF